MVCQSNGGGNISRPCGKRSHIFVCVGLPAFGCEYIVYKIQITLKLDKRNA